MAETSKSWWQSMDDKVHGYLDPTLKSVRESWVGSAVAGAGNMVTLGYSNEVTAGLRTVFEGGKYEDNLKLVQQRTQKAYDDHTTAYKVGSVVGIGFGLGFVGRGLSLLAGAGRAGLARLSAKAAASGILARASLAIPKAIAHLGLSVVNGVGRLLQLPSRIVTSGMGMVVRTVRNIAIVGVGADAAYNWYFKGKTNMDLVNATASDTWDATKYLASLATSATDTAVAAVDGTTKPTDTTTTTTPNPTETAANTNTNPLTAPVPDDQPGVPQAVIDMDKARYGTRGARATLMPQNTQTANAYAAHNPPRGDLRNSGTTVAPQQQVYAPGFAPSQTAPG